MNENMGYELDWNASIENDSQDWELLPEGDYDFEVLSFERSRHPGSAKLPPCNKAVLTLRLTGEGGKSSTIRHNLFLHTSVEGLLCAFFAAIGVRKKGERIAMDWTKVPGARGRCKVAVREWTNDSGEKKQSNDIKRFYEKASAAYQAGVF